MEIYLVGGAVRDELLQEPVSDRDWVVVGADTEQMLAAGYKQVGKDFPVFLHPHTRDEYALARTERKTAAGYTGFEVQADPGVTLQDDLLRRDLTINAIAKDHNGRYIDPFNGRQDIAQRQLRHVSLAFSEDPVRILRTARFAARLHARGFRVADETMQLMREMVSAGEADALVAERVWQEMQRALSGKNPQIFFQVLRDCGALAVILPEVDRLFGVPQKPQWHPEIDTGVHTMMVLQQAELASEAPEVRFAALCHDLGKGTTPSDILPSHHGHEERGAKLVEVLCERLRVPRNYRDLARLSARYHTHCHRVQELRASTVLKTLQALDAVRRPQRFEQFLQSCEADARGRTGFEHQPYPQADIFRSLLQAVNTVDTAAIAQRARENGADIGQMIQQARIAAIKTVARA